MSVGANIQPISINNFQPKRQTSFRGKTVPVQDYPSDTLEIKGEKKTGMSKGAKWGIGLGTATMTVLSGIIGIRKYKANYIVKAQKLFQEMFFNKDITREQTIEMLKKYKEISKIQDKEEYIKALFEETRTEIRILERYEKTSRRR